MTELNVTGQRWMTGIEGGGVDRGSAGQITGKKKPTSTGEKTDEVSHSGGGGGGGGE